MRHDTTGDAAHSPVGALPWWPDPPPARGEQREPVSRERIGGGPVELLRSRVSRRSCSSCASSSGRASPHDPDREAEGWLAGHRLDELPTT